MNVMRDLQVSFIEQKLKQGNGYSQLKTVFFEQYPTCSLRTFERRVVDAKARIKKRAGHEQTNKPDADGG